MLIQLAGIILYIMTVEMMYFLNVAYTHNMATGTESITQRCLKTEVYMYIFVSQRTLKVGVGYVGPHSNRH